LKQTRIKGKYLYSPETELIEDFLLLIEGNIIASVERMKGISSTADIDIGNSILIPGLINAHTHLELTGYRGKIRQRSSFPRWIEDIVSLKAATSRESYLASVSEGLQEGIKGGCTFFADISNSFESLNPFIQSGARGVIFYEAIGFGDKNTDSICRRIEEMLDEHNKLNSENVAAGISPHSPYSVSETLFKNCNSKALDKKLSMQIHLAESENEIEFLKSGRGPFFSLLSFFGQISEEWSPPGVGPVEYMKKLGLLRQNVSFVHLNNYSSSDMELLTSAGSSVVICPCSNNNWFGRDKSPITDALKAGVNIAIGTDSCASNSGINMFNELKMLRKLLPSISAHEAIKIATLNGAQCFGLSGKLGRIAPGYLADMISVPVNSTIKLKDVCEYVLMESQKVNFSMVNGEMIYFQF